MSIATRGQPLADLLAGLNAADRPTLAPQTEPGWERPTVFARDRTLRQVMADLGELLSYRWRKDDPPSGARDATRYTLGPDLRTQRYDHTLWDVTLDRGAAALFQLAGYLDIPEEQAKRLDAEVSTGTRQVADALLRRNLFYLGRGGPRFALEMLTSLSADQRRELLEQEQLVLSDRRLTDRQRALIHGIGLDVGRFRKLAGRGVEGETQEDSAAIADRYGIILSVSVDPVRGCTRGYSAGLAPGGIFAGTTEGVEPPDDLVARRGSPYGLNPNRPERRGAQPTYTDLQSSAFPPGFRLSAGRRHRWREVVAELARHLALPIYSDDYGFVVDPVQRQYGVDPPAGARNAADPPRLAGKSLADGLDALCDQYRYCWWHANGALYFRSRTWFIERQYEAPPPVEAALRRELASAGTLKADSLVLLSRLTERQLMGLAVNNVLLHPSDIDWFGTHPAGEQLDIESARRANVAHGAWFAHAFLQVFANLDVARRRKSMSADGLAFADMAPAQQELFAVTLFERLGPDAIRRPPNVYLKAAVAVDPDLARLRIDQDQPPGTHVTTARPSVAMITLTYRSGETLARVPLAFVPATSTPQRD